VEESRSEKARHRNVSVGYARSEGDALRDEPNLQKYFTPMDPAVLRHEPNFVEWRGRRLANSALRYEPKSRPGPGCSGQACETNPIFWKLPGFAAFARRTQFVEGRRPAIVPSPLRNEPKTRSAPMLPSFCHTNPIEERSTRLVDMRLSKICEETAGIPRSSTREESNIAVRGRIHDSELMCCGWSEIAAFQELWMPWAEATTEG
jgi:hypothetical protein